MIDQLWKEKVKDENVGDFIANGILKAYGNKVEEILDMRFNHIEHSNMCFLYRTQIMVKFHIQ